MTWTMRHTQNKKINWRINKSKSYFRFWATVHKHERVPTLDCTRHRATDVSWWERNDVSKIRISSIAETVRNCDELRPNYVLHSKSCRDPDDVGSADTFVYARSVCDPIWSCDCSTVRHQSVMEQEHSVIHPSDTPHRHKCARPSNKHAKYARKRKHGRTDVVVDLVTTHLFVMHRQLSVFWPPFHDTVRWSSMPIYDRQSRPNAREEATDQCRDMPTANETSWWTQTSNKTKRRKHEQKRTNIRHRRGLSKLHRLPYQLLPRNKNPTLRTKWQHVKRIGRKHDSLLSRSYPQRPLGLTNPDDGLDTPSRAKDIIWR